MITSNLCVINKRPDAGATGHERTPFVCDHYCAVVTYTIAALLLLGLLPHCRGQVSNQSSAGRTTGSRSPVVSPPVKKSQTSDPTLRPSTPRLAENPTETSDKNNSSPAPNTMEGLNDKRTLMIGDKLSFSISEDESPKHLLAVTDSGEIDVPYIGRVSTSSMTCKQLAYHVKRLLEREYYHQATVIIGLDAGGRGTLSRGRIYVNGQVRSPGPQEIPVDEVYTVGTAILRAGGFSPYAQKRKVKLVRANSEKGDPVIVVDLVEVLDKGDRQRDIEVAPGDQITVPEKIWNFFN